MNYLVFCVFSIISLFNSKILNQEPIQASLNANYNIVGKYLRSSNLLFFTEGLTFINEHTLVESCGLYGDSEIHFITNFDQDDSLLGNRYQFDKRYFAEGCDMIYNQKTDQNEYYMMTYKERTIFVLNDELNEVNRQYTMPEEIQEGWGMTHFQNEEGKDIILVSDGTNNIYHVDPNDFSIIKTITVVSADGFKVDQLNELEAFKNQTILANIWNTNLIAKINIDDGQLLAVYSFQGLVDDLESQKHMKGYTSPYSGNVLNGIAYNQKTDRLILGGKKWPYWYEIQLNE